MQLRLGVSASRQVKVQASIDNTTSSGRNMMVSTMLTCSILDDGVHCCTLDYDRLGHDLKGFGTADRPKSSTKSRICTEQNRAEQSKTMLDCRVDMTAPMLQDA